MVHLPFIAVAALAIVSSLAPSVQACEGQCKIYPTKFLYEKYVPMIQQRLASLPVDDRNRLAPKVGDVLNSLRGNDGVIADTIFSRFRNSCRDKAPHRSPDEVCGSAKSIACFAPWGHTKSVFDSVHAAVVEKLDEAFQTLMLKWEQTEHRSAYGNRTPNCSKNGHMS
ncbi:hypothetical protein BGZ92_010357 [Podila epicladia]|nr:hypothetical protein BGZ92_010357 [Podila epicladia]